MKTKSKIIVTIVVLVFLFFGSKLLLKGISVGKVEGMAVVIGAWMQDCIYEIHCFPPSEADLVRRGLLKKIETADGVRYFGCYLDEPETAWHSHMLSGFGLFKILYGATPENIEMIDGKLYDKATHRQILLIDGPYKEHLKDTYEDISRRWCELMVQVKHRVQNSDYAESVLE